ncbi:MAG: Trk system potassium transporter TrkA [Prevotellaceae bacterium]|jgi:trk system potassium uptake protein TrkA|nr:Trk system potassium transporter TrkA [Prevotellaceae bacterium]
MKIIIAGAGEVGSHLVRMLGDESHDITVIDPNEERIHHVSQLTDLVMIEGRSTSIETLIKANIHKADLFIAVNPSEDQDMNITSAILAKRMGAKKVIARINNDEYLKSNYKEIFVDIGIDYMFYPEKIAAREIIELLGQTSSTEYIDFSGGKLLMIVIKMEEDAPILGTSLKNVTGSDVEQLDYRVVAIARNGRTIIPGPAEEFKLHDMVYVISNQSGVKEVLQYSGKTNIDVNRLMILGGSRIGRMVAKGLENEVNIKLVDYDREKCEQMANMFNKALIINADGRNTDALIEEGLPTMDAFVAVTESSETNILACMAAKSMGVGKTIAEIENIDYIKLAESIGIDTIINKKIITGGRIFRFTMNTDVQAIKCLTGSDAEVLEFIAKPDSPVTRGRIKDVNFPKDVIISGVTRGDQTFIATGSSVINANDRVVVFALPSGINKIGKFFV